MEYDRAYYLRRAFEEDEAARESTCPEARRRHSELAIAYRRRTLTIEPNNAER